MREIQSGEYGCKIQLIKYNYAHNSKSTVATNLITIVTAHKDAWATERKETHSSLKSSTFTSIHKYEENRDNRSSASRLHSAQILKSLNQQRKFIYKMNR